MMVSRIRVMVTVGLLLASTSIVHAIPPTEKLNWGPEYYAMTCQPALQTRLYAELWPLMTPEERRAVNNAQQEGYIREQDVYRSWVRAFQQVLVVPERVKVRGQLYAGPIPEALGIGIAATGANETLAACVEHMAKQLALHR